MYCGNNRRDPRVVNGTLVIGNRYQCLQKGVGKGLTLPPNTGEYEPIFVEKIYCGKKNSLPRGYDRFGSNSQCFQKGVGVGKRIQTSSTRVSSEDIYYDADDRSFSSTARRRSPVRRRSPSPRRQRRSPVRRRRSHSR